MGASKGLPKLEVSSRGIEGERYVADVPDTLDLAERARIAVNVLTRGVAPEKHHAVWQNMVFSARPPYLGWPNLDIAPKYLESLPMMRVMCGSQWNTDIERSMMEAQLSLVGEDGLHYNPPEDDWAGAYPLLNGRLMLAMSYWHQRDRDSAWLRMVERTAERLRAIAIYRGDYAYYPPEAGYTAEGGWRFTTRKGKAFFDYHPPDEPARDQQGIEGGIKENEGNPVRALVRWYEMSGDEKALGLAGKLVTFMMKPAFWEPGRVIDLSGPEHAEFIGHFHANLVGLRSILEYGIATSSKRLKQFVRDGYTYARSFGISRIGWFPGSVYPEAWGRPRYEALRCEGCGIADMVALAVRLSQIGIGDYWEDVDQYVRNGLTEQQLTHSDLLQSASESSTAHKLQVPHETAEAALERMLGAFTDWAGVTHAGEGTGCCTANCSQALYYAWESIVTCRDGFAQVNLLLNRASPWVDVDSYLPYEGKVILRNKTAETVSVRIPYWVDKPSVCCEVDGVASPASWLGNYLIFAGLAAGDVVTVRFPMVEMTESYRVGDTRYTCQFKGNTLVDISPRDERPSIYPIYLRANYVADRAPMRVVERYVSPFTIHW